MRSEKQAPFPDETLPRRSSTVLLIQPWIEDFYGTDCRTQPLGLCSLKSALESALPEVSVFVLDLLTGWGRRTVRWPREFLYLKKYYHPSQNSASALFHDYFRYGAMDDIARKRIRSFEPLLIGISCAFTAYYREALRVAELCREMHPGVPIVMGGAHATLHPRDLLHRTGRVRNFLCDYVLRGEAEESLVELTEAVLGKRDFSNVSNLVTRCSRSMTANSLRIPDRSRMKAADFSSLDPGIYRYRKNRLVVLATSRSCPYRCRFCSVHTVFGFSHHFRSPESVIREILFHFKRGIRHFNFEDDHLTYPRERAHALLDGIIAMNLPVCLSAMNGLCYFTLDGELVSKMKRAGFTRLDLALVSTHPETCRSLRRPLDLPLLEKILESARISGIRCSVSFIAGIPGQTLSECVETLRYLSSQPCLPQLSPFYLVPGSRMHRYLKNIPGWKRASENRDPFLSARLSAMDVENDAFDRKDLYTLWRLTRLVNALKRKLEHSAHGPDAFDFAFSLLREGTWNDPGTGSSPVSHRILEHFRQNTFIICDESLRHTLTWNPDKRDFSLDKPDSSCLRPGFSRSLSSSPTPCRQTPVSPISRTFS